MPTDQRVLRGPGARPKTQRRPRTSRAPRDLLWFWISPGLLGNGSGAKGSGESPRRERLEAEPASLARGEGALRREPCAAHLWGEGGWQASGLENRCLLWWVSSGASPPHRAKVKCQVSSDATQQWQSCPGTTVFSHRVRFCFSRGEAGVQSEEVRVAVSRQELAGRCGRPGGLCGQPCQGAGEKSPRSQGVSQTLPAPTTEAVPAGLDRPQQGRRTPRPGQQGSRAQGRLDRHGEAESGGTPRPPLPLETCLGLSWGPPVSAAGMAAGPHATCAVPSFPCGPTDPCCGWNVAQVSHKEMLALVLVGS